MDRKIKTINSKRPGHYKTLSSLSFTPRFNSNLSTTFNRMLSNEINNNKIKNLPKKQSLNKSNGSSTGDLKITKPLQYTNSK